MTHLSEYSISLSQLVKALLGRHKQKRVKRLCTFLSVYLLGSKDRAPGRGAVSGNRTFFQECLIVRVCYIYSCTSITCIRGNYKVSSTILIVYYFGLVVIVFSCKISDTKNVCITNVTTSTCIMLNTHTFETRIGHFMGTSICVQHNNSHAIRHSL